MKNKQKSALIALVILIAIVGVSIWYMMAPSVSYIQGVVEATQVNVASKIPGRVEQVLVKQGQQVTKSEVLLKISTPEIDAKLTQVESLHAAALAIDQKVNKGAREQEIQATYSLWQQAVVGVEIAESTYKRVEALFEDKVLPAQKRDEALAQFKASQRLEQVAKANYDMVKSGARIEDKHAASAVVEQTLGAVDEVMIFKDEGSVISPRNAEVLSVMPNEGELVNAGYPLVNLIDLSDIWVYFNIKEKLMPHFKMGTKFSVDVPALGLKNVEIEVRYIAPQADYATWSATKTKGDFDMKTFLIKAYPTSSVEGLRPGMSVLIDESQLK